MAKVAAAPSNSLQMVGGSHKMGLTVKRKTPSELRVTFLIHTKFSEITNFVRIAISCLFASQGEQLKQKNVIELVDESPAALFGSTR